MHMQICENYYGQNISLFWIIHDSGLFERSVYLLDTDRRKYGTDVLKLFVFYVYESFTSMCISALCVCLLHTEHI